MSEETSLAVQENELQNVDEKIVKFDKFTSINEQLEYAKVLIESKLVPKKLNSPEKVVTVAEVGRGLGISFAIALQNIHLIEMQDGTYKPVIDYKVRCALLNKAGVEMTILEDMAPFHNPGIKGEAGKPNDAKTTIRYTKMSKALKREISQDISFMWSDAVKAGWTKKDNWTKYPKTMMRAANVRSGSAFVAGDAMMGIYDAIDMYDNNAVKNGSYTVNGDDITIID